jgi:hypothetical protein
MRIGQPILNMWHGLLDFSVYHQVQKGFKSHSSLFPMGTGVLSYIAVV